MMKKKVLSFFLAFTLLLSVFGTMTVAFADETLPEEPAQQVEVVKADQVIKVAEAVVLTVGKAGKVKASFTTGNGALTFISSDETVATVSKKGVVKAKSVGTATITVKAAETEAFAAAEATVTITVNPKAIVPTSLVCKKAGKFTIKWDKLKKVSGFEVRFAAKKSFKKAKVVKVKNPKATSKTVKNLKHKTKYYVQIRVYKDVDGVRYYSDWSKTKMIKVK